ncbi:FAD synthetase family protein [Thioclava sp. F28-4]|uniref:FAD synthetase family protein n=1 Tax=Thioclava sp. F28-4 TaxID=1915315 RepID=UPI0009962681|nr:FAD synthetase family protein [Thioclava sp. F28-4]OOY06047.1 FAD synthetase [Thioclava sp. F28-4]
MNLDFTGMKTQVLRDDQIALPASVLTIGAFDGVHRGHQALISRAVAEGRATGVPSVVWTFDPPPKVFFGRARQLSPLAEKLARIARLGPDYIVLASFCQSYAARSPQAFLDDLARINPARIHVGADFRFGAKQAGCVTTLAERFDVTLAPAVLCEGGEVISSTRIRGLRAEGRAREAVALQGSTDAAALMSGALLTQDMRFGEEFDVRN